jgi:uncharacterized protein YjbI with pentapeptide repeats
LAQEREPAHPVPPRRRSELRADCARCFGLCCVAPAFTASADFAIDKAAGQPCPNLLADSRCRIHDRLRQRGFPGCAVYDCFGAGQKVAQVTFGGQDWRHAPGTATRMFEVFAIMRQLHEMLWYLTEALAEQPAGSLHAALSAAFDETERLTYGHPDALVELDVAAHRRNVNALLLRTSELLRAGTGRHNLDRRAADLIGADLRAADLIGADLRGADLSSANMRGAYLIGADLTGAKLSLADVTGADLRGADLSGANLRDTIFLTQAQLDAAKGDAGTKLPRSLARPAHWPAATPRPRSGPGSGGEQAAV